MKPGSQEKAQRAPLPKHSLTVMKPKKWVSIQINALKAKLDHWRSIQLTGRESSVSARYWKLTLFVIGVVLLSYIVLPQPKQLYKVFYQNLEYDRAIHELKEAIKTHPGDTSLKTDLADIYIQKGLPYNSIEIYERLTKKYPDRVSFHRKLLELYLSTNQMEKALGQYEYLANLRPKDKEIHERLAELYELFNMQDRVMAQYEILNRLDPANEDYRDLLIDAYRANGEIEKEIGLVERKFRDHPDDYRIAENLASLYIARGDMRKATALMEDVLRRKAYPLSDVYTLMKLYVRNGMFSEALALHRTLLNVFPYKKEYTRVLPDTLVVFRIENRDIESYLTGLRNKTQDKQVLSMLANYYLQIDRMDLVIHVMERLMGMGTKDEKVAWAKELAEYYIQDNKLKEAALVLANVLDLCPRDVDAIRRLSQVYSWLNMPDKAANVYERLLNITNNRAEIMKNLVRMYLEAENIKKAIHYTEMLEDMFPRRIEYKKNLLRYYRFDNRPKMALEKLKELTGLEPENMDLPRELAREYVAHNLFQNAIGIYDQLLKERPGDLALRQELAKVYDYAGKVEESLKEYQFLYEKQPDDLKLAEMVAERLIWLNRGREAIPYLEKLIISDRGKPQFLKRLGEIYLYQGKKDLALHYLRKYVRICDEDFEAHFELGEIYGSLGSKEKAKIEYKRSLKIIEEGTRRPGEHVDIERRKEIIRARAYLRLRDYKKAAILYEKLVVQYPDDLTIKVDLAEALMENGHFNKAKYLIDTVLIEDPENIGAKWLKVRLHFQQKEYALASATLKEMIERDPTQVAPIADLAYVQYLQGKWRDSLSLYRDYVARGGKKEDICDVLKEIKEFYFPVVTLGTNYLNLPMGAYIISHPAHLRLHPPHHDQTFIKLGVEPFEIRWKEGGVSREALAAYIMLDTNLRNQLRANLKLGLNSNKENRFNHGLSLQYKYSEKAEIALSGERYKLWIDPVEAADKGAFFDEYNLSVRYNPTKKFFLKGDYSFGQYRTSGISDFGKHRIFSAEIGYIPLSKPYLSLAYNYTNSRFSYADQEFIREIPMIEDSHTHSSILYLAHTPFTPFSYEISQSVSRDTAREMFIYAASVNGTLSLRESTHI